MKRLLLGGGLACAALLVSVSEAPAWINFRFSAGLNWSWESGGNCILWGLVRGADSPYGGGGSYGFPSYGGFADGGYAQGGYAQGGYADAGYSQGGYASSPDMYYGRQPSG